MSTFMYQWKPLGFIAALLVTTSVVADGLHKVSPHSSGATPETSLMRREDKASLLEQEEVSKSKRDLYVLIGDNVCDGGGAWKRYKLNAVTPGRYQYCAAACDEKDECIGFDKGLTGCNLYTQKAVAVGTWPNVKFDGVAAFAGEGDHDKFPETPYDLSPGTTPFGTKNKFQCFRKTYYKPANSYYWKVGSGTCSGEGGFWKRYSMKPGDYNSCSNACNQRDECIGFDHGTWESAKGGEHEKGCFLYTQKKVVGDWPGVDKEPVEGQDEHKGFPATPMHLKAGHVSTFDKDGDAKCWAKTHWVSLASYYMELGKSGCTGSGLWKHYKMTGSNANKCKKKCDEKAECIGLDVVGGNCRLFTKSEVTGWEGVEATAAAGEGAHNAFAPNAFSLSPDTAKTEAGSLCLAKTHT